MSKLDEFIVESLGAACFDDLHSALRSALLFEGYENYVLVSIGEAGFQEITWYDFPEGYDDTYLDNRWHLVDPILPLAATAWRPFAWREALTTADLGKDQHRFLNDCAHIGVRCGETIPIHGPRGRLDVFSISRRHDGEPDPGRASQVRGICYQAWMRLKELQNEPLHLADRAQSLTQREIEILKWMRDGKANHEIAEILGLSVHTVKTHVVSILNKLGATNRISAVVIALSTGAIRL